LTPTLPSQAHSLLDKIFPLDGAQWSQVSAFSVHELSNGASHLQVTLGAGQDKKAHPKTAGLKDASQLAGYLPGIRDPRSVLLANNGLHLELQIDRSHPVGATHAAGVKDIQMESAMTAICDMEVRARPLC
jgi:malate synthase